MTAQTTANSQPFKSHRWFAACWDWMVRNESPAVRGMREELLSALEGSVLEIGCGTGANFAYYPATVEVVATEPDAYMLERAQRHVDELGRGGITLRQAPAEELPFEDASFDHVVDSWVLCHVRDVQASLAEARRLLRPGGMFVFMEHVRSDGGVGGTTQDVLNPLWRRLLNAGCNVNRRTQRSIEGAGFAIDWLKRERTGFPTSPAIYGVARVGLEIPNAQYLQPTLPPR
jgi:ubiquinone/menaquinone biosynthesis C-methylase UbiE